MRSSGGFPAFRLDQPLQRVADPEPERGGRPRGPESPSGKVRRLRPEPCPWRDGASRLRDGVIARTPPRLVVCDVSGYGASGPYRDKKAYDLLVQCEAGLVSVTGTPETPSKAGIAVADIAAGMYAYSGILAALLRRGRRGRGHRGLPLRGARRVDGLPRLLRQIQRQRAAPQRRQPRFDSPLRSLRVRRRQGRLPRHPERAGVGAILRGGAGAPGFFSHLTRGAAAATTASAPSR